MTSQSDPAGEAAAATSDAFPTVGVQSEREIVDDGDDAGTVTVTLEASADEPASFTVVERFDPSVAAVQVVDADGADLQGVRDARDGLFAAYSGREAVSLVYEVDVGADSAAAHVVEGRTSTTTGNGSIDESTVGDDALSSDATPCPDAANRDSVDGQTVCDVDGDGNYRDVSGDGSVTNTDVTEFFGNQHAPAWDERVDLFDFDGDDDVGQADVVDLFQYVIGH